MESWQYWSLILLNLLIGILLFLKDAINTLLHKRLMSEHETARERKNRTRTILIALHDYQNKYFSCWLQLCAHGFLWKTQGDSLSKQAFEESQRQFKALKFEYSMSELMPDVRGKLKPLIDDVARTTTTMAVTLPTSQTNEVFLRNSKEMIEK